MKIHKIGKSTERVPKHEWDKRCRDKLVHWLQLAPPIQFGDLPPAKAPCPEIACGTALTNARRYSSRLPVEVSCSWCWTKIREAVTRGELSRDVVDLAEERWQSWTKSPRS